MPRIMGIGNVSGLSKKYKPKRAGSFKGMGIILEGDPKRLRGLGKKKSLRGLGLSSEEHTRLATAYRKDAQDELQPGARTARPGCQQAIRALYEAGMVSAHSSSSGRGPAHDLRNRAGAAVKRLCGCGSKK